MPFINNYQKALNYLGSIKYNIVRVDYFNWTIGMIMPVFIGLLPFSATYSERTGARDSERKRDRRKSHLQLAHMSESQCTIPDRSSFMFAIRLDIFCNFAQNFMLRINIEWLVSLFQEICWNCLSTTNWLFGLPTNRLNRYGSAFTLRHPFASTALTIQTFSTIDRYSTAHYLNTFLH